MIIQSILILTLVVLLVIFQVCQWIWAFYRLIEKDCESKKEFFITLIPGMFIFYFIWNIKRFVSDFKELK
jgi:hypothetical protein